MRGLPHMFGATVFLCALGLHAQEAPAPNKIPVASGYKQISPVIDLLERQIARFGRKAPIFSQPLPQRVRLDGLGVTIRVNRPFSEVERAKLVASGIELGRPVANSVYPAWVPWAAVGELRIPNVVRVEPSWAPTTLLPLTTNGVVGVTTVRTIDPSLTGEGVRLSHIDSGVDVHHPHLFRADGGYFAWIDTNGDGAFSSGDAIDYNDDGSATSNETARVLDGAVLETFDGQVEGNDGLLQPATDWLYIDFNGDERRNFGRSEGFAEEDPGYGEPMFVVDDVNRDGELSVGEKVVLLRTSKIARVVDVDGEYVRGQNLIDAIDSEAETFAFHGTGVASIAVGGQPNFHNADEIGIAPGAELDLFAIGGGFNSDFFDTSLQARYLSEIEGPQILLHEWTNPFTAAQDGSTNIDAAMEALAEDGVLHVNPVGNLASTGKNLFLTTDQPTELSFDVGEGFEFRGELRPFAVAYVLLQWTSTSQFDLEVEDPTGATLALTPNQAVQRIGEAEVDTSFDITPRGNGTVLIVLNQSGGLEQGQWAMRIAGISSAVQILGRVTDRFSGWSPGIGWTNPTRDGSVAHPSTSDVALAVGAFAPEDVGRLRMYSGVGPRLDGDRVLDLVGPDNPRVALAATPELRDSGIGVSWFTRFGGTSGAAPHVSATLAILEQQQPDASLSDLAQVLFQTADAVGLEGAPNAEWGYGRIDAAAALTPDETVPENANPIAVLIHEDGVLDASGSTDPDGDSLRFRFDQDYDGEYDTEWSSTATSPALPGTWAKVEIIDTNLGRATAIVFTGQPDTMDMGDMGGNPDEPEEGCGCATISDPSSPSIVVFLLLCLGVFFSRKRLV